MGWESRWSSAFLTAGWYDVDRPLDGRRRGRPDRRRRVGAPRASQARRAPLHAVVNLVGGFAAGQPVAETPVEDFEAQFALNLRPTYLVCHAAIPRCSADGGAIVCISSATAHAPVRGLGGLRASKAAASLALARARSRKEGVRCNVVSARR